MSLSRRSFLKICGALPGASLLSYPLAVSAAPYQLIADRASKRFMTGANSQDASVWAFNGAVPGPELRFRKGDTVSVEFLNLLDEGSSIHWHGIRNFFAMDGVAGLTQAPVEPGQSFRYEFPLPDAGTYWYHSHAKTWSQVDRGLYGPLIVEDESDPEVDHDIVLVVDDWRLTDSGTLDEDSFGSLHDWTHGGRLGNWLTVNGESKPVISVAQNSRVRLRLINTANARVFGIQLPSSASLIAEDGFPRPVATIDYIEIGPAQRADLIVDLGSEDFALVETLNGNPLTAVTLRPGKQDRALVAKSSIPEPALESPPHKADLVVPIHMQGGAMGNLGEATFDGALYPIRSLVMEHQKAWAFNGTVPKMHETIVSAQLGQVVELSLWNDTRWEHAMHLHGHHFWIKEESGEVRPGKRDTHVFKRGEKASLVFIADNPGLWLFHCHMLEHHAAGMGGVIEVS